MRDYRKEPLVMHVTDCPHPKKRGYLTQEAAKAAMRISVNPMQYYLCRCGVFHLTSSRGEPAAADRVQIEQLLSMDDEAFRVQVRLDAQGRSSPQVAAALRTPKVMARWQVVLTSMDREYMARLAQAQGTSEEVRRGRSHLLRAQGGVLERIQEAKALRREWNKELMLERERLKAQYKRPGRIRREEAGDLAVKRLIRAHRQEFAQYLLDALEEIGRGAGSATVPGARSSAEAVRDSVPDGGDD